MDYATFRSVVLIGTPIFSYAIGFQYQNEWCKFFGLNLVALNVPLQHYFVQAFGVILAAVQDRSWVGLSMIAVGTASALAAFAPWARLRHVRWTIVCFGVVASATLAFYYAERVALQDGLALARHQRGRTVQFDFTDDFVARANAGEILRANEADRLGVVWQDKDYWIVVAQDSRVGTSNAADQLYSTYTYKIDSRWYTFAQTRDVDRLARSVGR